MFSNCFSRTTHIDPVDQLHKDIEHAETIARTLNVNITGLWQKIKKLESQAKERYKVGDKDDAKSKMMQLYRIAKTRKQYIAVRDNIVATIDKLEETHRNVAVARTMGTTGDRLQQLLAEADADHVEDMMDSWRDAMSDADQFGTALGDPLEDIDVDKELTALIELPDAPSTAVSTSKGKKRRTPLLN